MQRKTDAQRLSDAQIELSALKRVMEVGARRELLSAALRVINRRNLTEEYVLELEKSSVPMREATAADLGLTN